MVAQTFVVFDSASLVVDSSSSAAIVGNGIINNSSTPNGTIFTYTAGSAVDITLDDVGGSPDTFEDDQTGGHTITDGGGLVTNGTGVEAESIVEIQALDGVGNPTGPIITLTVFSQNGVTGDVWGFSSDGELVDGLSYIKINGSNIGSSDYDTFVTCFGAGTLIEAAKGPIQVQDLNVGEMVWTKDAGLQPITWVGRNTVRATGPFAPVVIQAGALGNTTELVVSQEHRMFFSDGLSDYLFGEPDVLIAAKHLCTLPGVSIVPRPAIQYTHIMFDQHHILRSNGMLSESFFLSENAVSGLDRGAHDEVLALFPSLSQGQKRFGDMAARSLKQHEALVWCGYMAA